MFSRSSIQMIRQTSRRLYCTRSMRTFMIKSTVQTLGGGEASLDTIYDQNERDAIFRVINYGDLGVLVGHNMAKYRARNIIIYREKNGPFQSLDEMLELDGFGLAIVHTFCKNIIGVRKTDDDDAAQRLQEKLDRGASTSICEVCNIPNDVKPNIQSVIAVSLSEDNLVWSYMDNQGKIVDFDHKLFIKVKRGSDLNQNIQMARKFLERLPMADAYLVDPLVINSKSRMSSREIRFASTIIQIDSALMTMLPEDRLAGIKPNVLSKYCFQKYGVRKMASCEMIRLLVDKQRIVTVSPILRQRFSELRATTKSRLIDCVIKSVGFYQMDVKSSKWQTPPTAALTLDDNLNETLTQS